MGSREIAVCTSFEKMDQVGTGCVATCKDCGKAAKVLKGNTTNLMSHLRTKHPKIHEEMGQKLMKRSIFVSNPCRLRSLMTSNRLGMAANKAKVRQQQHST